MNSKYFYYSLIFLIIFSIYSCATLESKIDKINSDVNFDNLIKISNYDNINNQNFENLVGNQTPNQFIDSIKQKLIKDKKILVDVKYKYLTDKIDFPNIHDTIYLSNLKIKSPSGGVPSIYDFTALKGDVIFYELENSSIFPLKSISILEGKSTRFKKDNFRKRDKIKGSFYVTEDNVIQLIIDNDRLIKNWGLFKSKLNIKIKTLSTKKLVSEVINDTIFTTKKIIETTYDTICQLDLNNKFDLFSKRTITENSSVKIPLNINLKDSTIAWAFWIGLNEKDSIDLSDPQTNIFSLYAKNELNNVKNNTIKLISTNNDIEISLNNFTFDRRSFNFSENFALYKIDNDYTKNPNKGQIVLSNRSKLYDYKVQFALMSIYLKPIKNEVEKDIGEIKKFIKLELE